MFLKRNRSRQGGEEYTSILLVQGERVPVKRGPGRPAKGEVAKTTVVHRTLANLSALPPALVDLIEQYCIAEREGKSVTMSSRGEGEPVVGPAYGPLGAMVALARELGIERALGSSRYGRLCLFLVLARVLHQGSRLSSVRWASAQATELALGVAPKNEDELYRALDWLAAEQPRIEKELAPACPRGAVFLYDVTSSYLEGEDNELAAYGYNRDGKRHKKQVVVGLLTDAEGHPVSIHVYEGQTSDPTTVADQVRKLARDFDGAEVILVGDRGMLKGPARTVVGEHGFRFVTALTDAQIRRKLREGALQLELFTETVVEVMDKNGERLLLRRNPATAARQRARRDDKLATVRANVDARNAFVDRHPRASAETSLARALRALRVYKLDTFVSARLQGRRVVLDIDAAKRASEEDLDGCYVVVSDVPKNVVASGQTLWDRYGDLQKVERNFRTLKTGLLDLRPIFLRKAGRTRGHALVSMLALQIVRELEDRLRPTGLTVRDALDRLDGVRLVSLADPELGLWRLPSKWDTPQRQVLDVLPPLPAPSLLSAARAA